MRRGVRRGRSRDEMLLRGCMYACCGRTGGRRRISRAGRRGHRDGLPSLDVAASLQPGVGGALHLQLSRSICLLPAGGDGRRAGASILVGSCRPWSLEVQGPAHRSALAVVRGRAPGPRLRHELSQATSAALLHLRSLLPSIPLSSLLNNSPHHEPQPDPPFVPPPPPCSPTRLRLRLRARPVFRLARRRPTAAGFGSGSGRRTTPLFRPEADGRARLFKNCCSRRPCGAQAVSGWLGAYAEWAQDGERGRWRS